MIKLLPLTFFAFAAVGCGEDPKKSIDTAKVPDASIDAAPDAPPDAPPDARQDLSVDAAPGSIMLSTQGVYANFATRTIPFDAIAYNVK